MLDRLRARLTYSNVMATIAVFVALGGTSIAAVSLSRNSVKGKHIAANAVSSPKVKDASLLARDFASGQLPKGDRGDPGVQGQRGDTGPAGADGSPDTPAQLLAKLLGVDGSGSSLDADLLDGLSANAFLLDGAAANGDLTGTYPAPTIDLNAVGAAEVSDGTLGPDELAAVPTFRGTGTSSQTVSSGTELNVPLGDVNDPQNMHAAGSADVVIPRTGFYLLTATFTTSGTGNGSSVGRKLTRNLNTAFPVGVSQTTDPNDDMSMATIVRLNATDTVQINVLNPTAADMTVFASNTHLEVVYLGR